MHCDIVLSRNSIYGSRLLITNFPVTQTFVYGLDNQSCIDDCIENQYESILEMMPNSILPCILNISVRRW